MTKPLGRFQPPSDTMLWGSRAIVWLSDCLTARLPGVSGVLWFCGSVLCFVFRVLCVALRSRSQAAYQPTCCPSGLVWQPATRRCFASNKATRNDTAAYDKTRQDKTRQDKSRPPALIDGDGQEFEIPSGERRTITTRNASPCFSSSSSSSSSSEFYLSLTRT